MPSDKMIKYFNLIRRISEPHTCIKCLLCIFILFPVNFHSYLSSVIFFHLKQIVIRIILKVNHIPNAKSKVTFFLSSILYHETFWCHNVLILHRLAWILFKVLIFYLLQWTYTDGNCIFRGCKVSTGIYLYRPILFLFRLIFDWRTNQSILRF